MKDNSSMARPDFKEDMIDLRHYWRVLMQQKWNIIGLSFVFALLAAMVVFSMTPIYKATTTVLIENQEAKYVSIEDVYGLNTTNKEYFLTQFEILKSRELAEKVIQRLHLEAHPMFDPRQQSSSFDIRSMIPIGSEKPALTETQLMDKVVDAFKEGLTISPIDNTQLVKIHYESADPELSALIANTLADVYIESYLEAKMDVTKKATTWLSGRLSDLKAKLQASEEKLQAYREQAQLVDVQGVQTLDAEELEQLTQRYVDAKRTRSEAETIYRQVNRLGGSASSDQLMKLSSVQSQPLVQRLKEAQSEASRKVAELSRRYGAKHPKMIAAKSEASEASRALRAQVLRVGNGIANDYSLAKETENSLRQQIADAKVRVQGLNRKEFKLRELEREVQTNRQLYETFLTRAKETDEAGGLNAAHARIIDQAVAPIDPVKPKKGLLIILAAAGGALLGGVLALFLEGMNNTVRTPEDVEDKLQVPMLGFLPAVKAKKGEAVVEGFLSGAHANFAEAVRTIRTSLMLSNIDAPYKVTLITSSVPDEGKSTVALNLAEAVGQMEKVLLIDADMRKPTLGKAMGLPRSAPGLSAIVAGMAEFKDCVHRIENTSVDVLPSGVIPSNPLELLSSKRFVQVLNKLGERYDRIIIDSAPTYAVSDARVLATYADAVVYVVKAEGTPAHLAAKGIKRLLDVGAPITGVVLNKVDVEKATSYGGESSGYYFDYGYTAEAAKS